MNHILTNDSHQGAVFLYGIKTESLSLVREHLDRLIGETVKIPTMDSVQTDDSDEDVMPENLNHMSTVVDALSHGHTRHV